MHKVRDNDIITSNLVHIIVVHVAAVKIYVAAVEALRKKERQVKTWWISVWHNKWCISEFDPWLEANVLFWGARVTQPPWLHQFRLGWTQVHPNYWISCTHWGWVPSFFFFPHLWVAHKKNLFDCPNISNPNYLLDFASTYLQPKPHHHSNLIVVVCKM